MSFAPSYLIARLAPIRFPSRDTFTPCFIYSLKSSTRIHFSAIEKISFLGSSFPVLLFGKFISLFIAQISFLRMLARLLLPLTSAIHYEASGFSSLAICSYECLVIAWGKILTRANTHKIFAKLMLLYPLSRTSWIVPKTLFISLKRFSRDNDEKGWI